MPYSKEIEDLAEAARERELKDDFNKRLDDLNFRLDIFDPQRFIEEQIRKSRERKEGIFADDV